MPGIVKVSELKHLGYVLSVSGYNAMELNGAAPIYTS